jgi:hypothetical protein
VERNFYLPKTDDPNAVEDARNALVAHYSSKSSNEAQILLGLAVALFALIQAYSVFSFLPVFLRNASLTWGLGIIAYLIIRQTGRIVYWGELADAITVVGMVKNDVVIQALKDIKNKMPKVEQLQAFELDSTYILRLGNASSRYVDYYRMMNKENRLNVLIQICRISNDQRFARGFLAIVAALGVQVGLFSYL